MGWTLVSLAASGHARGGLPQVKKFYVWLMLFVVFSALRHLNEVRILVMCLGGRIRSLLAVGIRAVRP